MPNRRPTAARARALELLAQGLSERDVVAQLGREGMKVSKGSVGNWKKAGDGVAHRPAKAAPAPSPAASEAAPIPEQPPSDEWELPGVDLVHLPAELLERLAKKFAAKIAEVLAAPLCDFELLGKLIQGHERLVKALVMARPPTERNPDADPANLEMAAIAISHIRRMVDDVRARRAREA